MTSPAVDPGVAEIARDKTEQQSQREPVIAASPDRSVTVLPTHATLQQKGRPGQELAESPWTAPPQPSRTAPERTIEAKARLAVAVPVHATHLPANTATSGSPG